MQYSYYRSRRKKNKSKKNIAGLFLMIVGGVTFLAAAIPSLTGKFGATLHEIFFTFAGGSSLLLPLFLVWAGFQQVTKEKKSLIKDTFSFAAFFVSIACLFSLFHTSSANSPGGLGGWVGDTASLFIIHQFGSVLAFIFGIIGAFLSGCILAKIPPTSLFFVIKSHIEQDIEHWKDERKRIQNEKSLKKKIEKVVPIIPEEPIVETPPRIITQTLDPGFGKTLKSKLSNFAKKSENPTPVSRATEQQQLEGAEQTDLNPNPYENYIVPGPELLSGEERILPAVNKEELYANGTHLEKSLEQFGVKAKVIDIHPGPVITRYDLSPAPGVRVQQIESLSDDIALAMKAQSLRVLAPVPGKAAVGIEISNSDPATVYLKEMILSHQFQKSTRTLPLVLGKTTEGDSCVADLSTMPHLLIAGATGSGKSVCIHSIILSILFRFRPDEVKLLLIDPKRLEMPVYDGIPHLYDPAQEPKDVKVITQPKDVVFTLKKLCEVMDARYKEFATAGVRNIEGFNDKAKSLNLPKAAYLVVIIDELADLMIAVGKEIEELIQRLAQMARAVGIHLILATQRPSVNVITGVIKANLPSRISFQVLSKTDSRVVLDSQGAEDLLGKGDMLFLATGAPKPVRLQGSFVTETDVVKVIQFINEQQFKPSYLSNKTASNNDSIVDTDENRHLLVRAAHLIKDTEKVSGDLLRSDKEIGSKYDLALILLKKKGIIEKPKDTNRWKIHYDRLEQFLVAVEFPPDPQ